VKTRRVDEYAGGGIEEAAVSNERELAEKAERGDERMAIT
jgi:hypothetical protein